MAPEELARLLRGKTQQRISAAELIEAIDNPGQSRKDGLNLMGWQYEMIPWGVRFTHPGDGRTGPAEVVAVVVLDSTRMATSTEGQSTVLLLP